MHNTQDKLSRLLHSAYNTMHMITWISCLHCINPLIKPIPPPPPPPPYAQYTNSCNTLVYCFPSVAQLVHDAPSIRMDTSLPTLSGLVRNGYLLPGTQVLESSIMSSCTILHSYRLCPISFYQCRDQCSGYWVQWYSVGFLCMCGLVGKVVAFLWP